MPENERAGLMDKGQPGSRANERLRAAIFHQAYEDTELVRIFAQAADVESKAIIGALSKAAPSMARLKGTDLDIRGIVSDAAKAAITASRSGIKIGDAAKQTDIERGHATQWMLSFFADNIRSPKRISDMLNKLAERAYDESNKADVDMFGSVSKLTKNDLLKEFGYEPSTTQGDGNTNGRRLATGTSRGKGNDTDGTDKAEAGEVIGRPELSLTGQSEEEINAAAQAEHEAEIATIKAERDAANQRAKEAEEKLKADNVANGNAADSFTLDQPEPVSKAKQKALDKKKAESELAWQTDLLSQSNPESTSAQKNKPGDLPSGVLPEVAIRLEAEYSAAKDAVAAEEKRSELLHESDNIPGAFQAGRTNYTMGRQREAMNNRLSAQHDRLTSAKERLKKAESILSGYKSGEFHENGQPRADSPSRAATATAVLSYADFIRETVKPGDRVTFAPNPSDAGRVVIRLNKNTVTLDGGTTWGYDNIQPWIDGKPASAKEVMAAFKAWSAKSQASDDITVEQANRIHTLEAQKDLFERIYNGTVSVEDYRAAFDALLKNKEGITAELSALTKDGIFKIFPGLEYRYKNDKKADIIDAAYRGMVTQFVLGDSLSYGMGKNAMENAVKAIVESATTDDLSAFADGVSKSAEALSAGIKNPQTLDDFDGLMRAKAQEIGEGATFSQARMALTPEQGTAIFNQKETGAIPEAEWLSVSAIEEETSKLVEPFATEIPVLFHDTIGDIGVKSTDDGVVSGAVHGGKIHLFRDGLADRSAVVRTLWHELLHFGFRRFMTEPQYIAKMNTLYMQDAWVRSKAKSWVDSKEGKKLAETKSPAYARARGVDEALAELAEVIQTNPTGFQTNTLEAKAIRTVREWVAKLADFFGFKEAAQTWRGYAAQKDARDLIASTFGKLRDGAPSQFSNSWSYSDPAFMTAYHGSPHDHDKFDMGKVGTGEGARVYGYGLYFSGSREVAEWYKRKLSKTNGIVFRRGLDNPLNYPGWAWENLDSIRDVEKEITKGIDQITAVNNVIKINNERISSGQISTYFDYPKKAIALERLKKYLLSREAKHVVSGKLYTVELAPSEEEYLDWDKPLSEQSEKVLAALEQVPIEIKSIPMTGEDIYGALSSYHSSEISGGRNDKAASEYLQSIGIRGVRYLDGSSRSSGSGTSNYVIFNDADVAITAKASRRATPATGITEQSLRNAFTHKFPRLSRALDKMLQRGKAGQKGGVVLTTGDGLAQAFADKTGRTLEDAKAALQMSLSGKLLAPNGKPSKLNARQWAQVRTPVFKAWFGDWENDPANASKIVDENGEPMVVYHGSETGGFTKFSTGRHSKVDGAYFFSDNSRTARTYSGIDTEIDLNTADEDGYGDYDKQRGIVSAFLNIRNAHEYDFDGANWDGTNGKASFDLLDGNGDITDTVYEYSEVQDALDAGTAVDYQENADIFTSTDNEVRDAKRFGADGAILSRVRDDGRYDNFGGDPSTIYVALRQEDIKSATQNTGAFDPNNQDIRYSKDGNIQAFYDPKSGLHFMVTDNLDPSTAANIMLHESIHSNQRDNVDKAGVRLLTTVRRMASGKLRTYLDEAANRMVAAGAASWDRDKLMITDEQEAAPYLVEVIAGRAREAGFSVIDGKFMDWVDSQSKVLGKFIRDFVATIRAAMLHYGVYLKNPTVDDLVAYAQASMKRAAKGEVQTDGGNIVSGSEAQQRFYSQLRRVMSSAPDKVFGSAAQVKLWLQKNAAKNEVKKDEIFWTGINEFLDIAGKVSKADVLAFLDANGVQVEVKVLGEGGKNAYTERDRLASLVNENIVLAASMQDLSDEAIEGNRLTFTLTEVDNDLYDQEYNPAEQEKVFRWEGDEDIGLGDFDTIKQAKQAMYSAYQNIDDANIITSEDVEPDAYREMIGSDAPKHGGGHLVLPGGTEYMEMVLVAPQSEKWGESDTTHYGDTGAGKTLAWTRYDTRTDAQGRTGTLVEEVQSTRGQAGRSYGFPQPPKYTELPEGYTVKSRREGSESDSNVHLYWVEDADGKRITADSYNKDGVQNEAINVLNDKARGTTASPIPIMPFVSDSNNKATNAYIKFALKHQILQAIDAGHSFVAWTTGSQQAERYSLYKQVSRIEYNESSGAFFAQSKTDDTAIRERNIKPSDLENLIGKDAAEKILKQQPDPSGMRVLSGQDLKVSPAWTAAMYGDENGMNAKGEPALVTQAVNSIFRQLKVDGKVESMDAGTGTQQPGFTITDTLRNHVLQNGLPLFSKNADKQNQFDGRNVTGDDSASANMRQGSPADTTNAQGVTYGLGHKILATRLARLRIPGIDADNGRVGRIVPEQQQKAGQEERGSDGNRTGGTEETARAEQAKLIAEAKANGFFYEDENPFMRAVMAHENRGGTEHDAYIVGEAPNIVVIRSTAKSGFGLTSSDSPAQYLERMAEYNATFPLLQIRVIGVSQNSDGVPAIWTAQSFIHGKRFKNHDELTAAFVNKGWEKVKAPGSPFRYRHKETGAVIDDAHIFNVLHIDEKLYPIDIVVKEVPKNGSVIKFSRSGKTPGIQPSLPGTQATPAKLRKAKHATMEEDVSFVDRALRGAFRLTHADKLIDKSFDFVLRNVGELIPETIKAGIVSDYGLDDAYVDRKADMKAAEAASARKTQGMIEMLSGLTRAESRVAYYWMQEKPEGAIEQRLLDQLPEASRETLAQLKLLITHLGKEAVRLGQLSAESQARNNMSYLHRTYAKHVLNQEGKIAQMLRARSMRIKGDQYKGRGIFEEVPMDRIMSENPVFWRKLQAGKADKSMKGEKLIRFERRDASAELMDALDGFEKKSMGKLREVVYWPASAPVPAKYGAWVNAGTFEVRDTKGDKLVVWRDLTREERTKLGELDEVRYAVAQTISLMTHDIEVGRLFEWVSSRYAKPRPEGREVEAKEGMLHAFGKDTWVQVPSSNIPGTQVKKYGKLAGLYVPGPVWNDMRQVAGYQQGGFAKLYGPSLRFWKKSKTAWTPGVHVSNVMANFILADWHDIRSMDMAEALKVWALNNKPGYKELFQRFEDSGALGGMFASNELLREEIGLRLEEMKADLTGEQDAEAETGKMAKVLHLAALAGVPFKGYAKHMGNAYQNEDAFFRLAVFIKAVRYGKTDMEAGKMARHAFLNYDINAPWIQAARHTVLPFISFPYRALPMLVNTIQHKPWKAVKLMAFASLVNMLSYAVLGDDDDEDKERKLLPEQKQGKLWGIVPKMTRMPWNSDTGAPVFLDVRRWVPVGDIADLDQGHGLPPSLVPGGPLVTMAEAFLFNKSLFTQKEITKETDDFIDAANKKLDHVFKSMMPNVPVPNPLGYMLSDERGQYQTYAISGIHNAIDRKENTIGEVRSPVQSGLNAFGIKVSSYPKQNMEAAINIDLRKKVNALKDELVKAQRDYNRLDKPSSEDYKALMAKIKANEKKMIEARNEAEG
ncbi:MAG: hypothetical protein Q8O37_16890 [Sulfuricellaceae bacterium]|nr:hypothetical protein [Sulfuricellaceae bacterium]